MEIADEKKILRDREKGLLRVRKKFSKKPLSQEEFMKAYEELRYFEEGGWRVPREVPNEVSEGLSKEVPKDFSFSDESDSLKLMELVNNDSKRILEYAKCIMDTIDIEINRIDDKLLQLNWQEKQVSKSSARIEEKIDNTVRGEEEKQNTLSKILSNDNVFYDFGGNWYIQHKGETLSPKNNTYLPYIAHLLKNPYPPNKFTIDEIFLKFNPSLTQSTSEEQREDFKGAENGVSYSEASIEFMDDEYIKDVKKVREVLEEEKTFAENNEDIKKVADIERKIKIIDEKCLSHVNKKKNKSYKDPGKQSKNKKAAIFMGIKRVKDDIKTMSKKKDYNELLIWNHFEQCIKLDTDSVYYCPETSLNWYV